MYIDLTPELKDLQMELRDYFENDIMTAEMNAEMNSPTYEGGGPVYMEKMQKMGKDGWLGIGWPKEYGGQDRTPLEQFVFADEVQRAGFPLPFLTLSTVGPTLMHYGSQELKDEILPKILAGKLHFSIGYSEPGAGTDLASLKTRAHKDGDDWVINGQKTWTSLATYADYVWIAARTDPDAKKHKGLTMFVVPTSDPGFDISPIWTIGGMRTNQTFYDNVRVSEKYMVGELNGGWKLMTSQLNHERVSLFPYGPFARLVEGARHWAQNTQLSNGKKVIDLPYVQTNLAKLHANIETLRLMIWKQAWTLTHSQLSPAEASTVKVFASEFMVEGYRSLMEIFGVAGVLDKDSPGAVLHAKAERGYRSALILTFGGGTNEVQRDIIAMAGLLMPHYK